MKGSLFLWLTRMHLRSLHLSVICAWLNLLSSKGAECNVNIHEVMLSGCDPRALAVWLGLPAPVHPSRAPRARARHTVLPWSCNVTVGVVHSSGYVQSHPVLLHFRISSPDGESVATSACPHEIPSHPPQLCSTLLGMDAYTVLKMLRAGNCNRWIAHSTPTPQAFLC